jgi:NFU1 iron-sulfur cluster scaffold homolog, mitochondrial
MMKQLIIEPTSNERVMKFIADYNLVEGSIELTRESDYSNLPLAQELFNFPFVNKVFVTANFVAVAKEDTVSWEDVVHNIKNTIEDSLLAHPSMFLQQKRVPLSLYAEMTPNPAVMKFVSNTGIVDGFVEVKSRETADDVPLAKAIFDYFDFATEVFISDNFVSVTKNTSVEWHEVMVEMRAFIVEYIQKGGPINNRNISKHEAPAFEVINRDYTEIEEKINQILQEYVAPAVENDGGKISLMEYIEETKTAQMLLQGACSGCPSSSATLKNGIENILKQFLPDVVEHVEAVNG